MSLVHAYTVSCHVSEYDAFFIDAIVNRWFFSLPSVLHGAGEKTKRFRILSMKLLLSTLSVSPSTMEDYFFKLWKIRPQHCAFPTGNLAQRRPFCFDRSVVQNRNPCLILVMASQSVNKIALITGITGQVDYYHTQTCIAQFKKYYYFLYRMDLI